MLMGGQGSAPCGGGRVALGLGGTCSGLGGWGGISSRKSSIRHGLGALAGGMGQGRQCGGCGEQVARRGVWGLCALAGVPPKGLPHSRQGQKPLLSGCSWHAALAALALPSADARCGVPHSVCLTSWVSKV